MSNKVLEVSALVHHKPSGQGRVRIAGRDFYCGRWEDPETDERYRRLVAEYVASGQLPNRASARVDD